MSTLTPELLQQGLQLLPQEREKFANLLLESIDDTDENRATWRAELERRVNQYLRGETATFSLEETMKYAREQLVRRRSS